MPDLIQNRLPSPPQVIQFILISSSSSSYSPVKPLEIVHSAWEGEKKEEISYSFD
jgi:hypothetical protein